jgi:hypothetical protein
VNFELAGHAGMGIETQLTRVVDEPNNEQLIIALDELGFRLDEVAH